MVTYPSNDVPGPVRVSVDVPEGWLVQPAPGVAFVAASPEESGGVHSNAVVSIRRVDSEITLEQLVQLVDDEVSQLPGVSVTERDRLETGGRELAVRAYDFVNPEDGANVHQMQAMCLAAVAEHVADAVSLTITHGADLRPEELASLRDVVISLRIV